MFNSLSAPRVDYLWVRAVVRAARLADYADLDSVELDGIRPATTPLEKTLLRGILAEHTLRRRQRSAIGTPTGSRASLLALIEQQACREDCTPNRLATARRVSISTLQRQCRALTGRTIMEQVNHVRISKARTLLLETLYSVKEIAALTGHASASALNRHFKLVYGVRPSELRKRE